MSISTTTNMRNTSNSATSANVWLVTRIFVYGVRLTGVHYHVGVHKVNKTRSLEDNTDTKGLVFIAIQHPPPPFFVLRARRSIFYELET